jgi:hypothetical protein
MKKLRRAYREDTTLIPRARAVMDLLMEAHPYEVLLREVAKAGGIGGYRARVTECRTFMKDFGFRIDVRNPCLKKINTRYYKLVKYVAGKPMN